MSNRGFKRKIVKCGNCGEPRLVLYGKDAESIIFKCKCGAINKYRVGTKGIGEICEKGATVKKGEKVSFSLA